MADPLALQAAILKALRGIPDLNGRVHDGHVPDKIAVDTAGYILPYVVFFGGVGEYLPERNADGTLSPDALIYDFQTTAVGPLPGHAANVARQVRGALLNLRVGTGKVIPNPDGFNQQTPIRDSNVTPARFMLPQQWRLHTN